MGKDISKNMGLLEAIAPAVYTADNTPAAVSVGNYDSAIVAIHVGVGGITFDSTNKIEFKLTHSLDNSTYTAVAQADVKGVTVGTGGVVLSLTAAHAAASITKVGYNGGYPYLKLLADFSGTHGTGTPISACVIGGRAHLGPV